MESSLDEKLHKIDGIVYGHNHESLYAFKLINLKKYDKPISIKGKLGLWNYQEDK